MKRRERAWPNIVEVPSTRVDPRADPQATQRISREQLDDALQRTKSGTRPIVRQQRAEPENRSIEIEGELLAGPRDSLAGPLETETPSPGANLYTGTLGTPVAPVHISIANTPDVASPIASKARGRLILTPRLALIVALSLAAFVVVAGVVGFLAGRHVH